MRSKTGWIAMVAGLLVAALATPSVSPAQPRARTPTVVVIAPGVEKTPAAISARAAFERGLKELGWTPGHNVRVEFRYAEGRSDRLEDVTRSVVRETPDVIVARSSAAIEAAKRATATIPVVMSAAGFDPVELGFVASLARPGGNITGLTLLNQDLPVKQLQVLKETVPGLARVGILGSTQNRRPSTAREALEAAARSLGLQLYEVRPRNGDDLDEVFADLVRWRAGGVVVLADPFVLEANAARIVALARKHQIPAMYWLRLYPEMGGLMSYGADLFAIIHRAASYTDRILRGAKPADLPVEEPTKFSLVVNRKTVRTLGLDIPASVMARVNEVIE